VNATDQASGIFLMSSPNSRFNYGTDISHVSGNLTYGIAVTISDDTAFRTTAVSFITAASDAYGISLQGSDDAEFSSNTTVSCVNATDLAYGIYLLASDDNAFNCSTTVSYANATNEAYGIFLSGSGDNEFYNCTISNLTAGNETYGVYVADASTNNTISDGAIRDNNHGIRVENSDSNTVRRNMIVNNTGGATGVNVTDGSDGNKMEGNCFIENMPQAWDDGSQNVWNGNYWSEYTGPGPYNIGGAANSKDDNPLDECPLIASPAPPAPKVPTVTHWGIVAMVILFAGLLVWMVWRRQHAS